MDKTKKFSIKIGYLIALKISFSSLLNKANKKKGIETIVDVDAIGSTFLSEIIKAKITNNKEMVSVKVFPNTIGKVLSPEEASPSKSGIVVIRATEEKDNV